MNEEGITPCEKNTAAGLERVAACSNEGLKKFLGRKPAHPCPDVFSTVRWSWSFCSEFFCVHRIWSRPGQGSTTCGAERKQIFAHCQANQSKAVLITYPFGFQVREKNISSIPQTILLQFASENQIPALDLLPLLNRAMEEKHLTPDEIFIDHCHFTVRGHQIVARLIADFLTSANLVPVK